MPYIKEQQQTPKAVPRNSVMGKPFAVVCCSNGLASETLSGKLGAAGFRDNHTAMSTTLLNSVQQT
jgi:hypothetical protein